MPKLNHQKQLAHAINYVASIERQAREAGKLLRAAQRAQSTERKAQRLAIPVGVPTGHQGRP